MKFFRVFLLISICNMLAWEVCSQEKKLIDSLEHLLNTQMHDTVRLGVLENLYDYYLSHNLDKALGFASQVRDIAIDNGGQETLLQGLEMTSIIYSIQGKYELALKYDKMCLDAAKVLHDSSVIVLAINNIGNDYLNMDNYQEANRYFLEALKMSEVIDSVGTEAMVRLNLSRLFKIQGNLDLAHAYVSESKKLYTSEKDTCGIAYALYEMGGIVQQRGDYEKALSLLDESLEISKRMEMEELIPEIMMKLAFIYEYRDDYDKALEYYYQALGANKELPDKSKLAENYLGLGKLQGKMGATLNAEKNLNKGLLLAKSLLAKSLQAKTHKALAELYDGLQRYQSACYHFKEYDTLQQSILNMDIRKQIAEIQAKYESERKDKEIAQLNESRALQDIKIAQQSKQSILLFLSIAFLGLLAIILTLNIVNKRRANRLLLSQKQEIEHQSRQLEELNVVKDKFFTVVSHDLRAPFHSLSGVLELISSGMVSPEEIQLLSRELKLKFDKTKHLLDNLLEWGRIQMKEVKYEPMRISLYEAVEDVLGIVNSAYDKDIQLHNHTDKAHEVKADVNMFQLILRNLVTNAIKFTEEGGTVAVRSLLTGSEVRITVEDTGIGISEENQKKLFHNANSYTTLGTGNEIGTGLGLGLCREFVIKNGGRIWVESKVGEGSRFSFTLKSADNIEKG